MSGFTPSRTAVPVRPTMVDRMKPGLERSIMYQRSGLTRASVSEPWRVDCHGSLRCTVVSYVIDVIVKRLDLLQ